jgi:hypothetical protein
MLVSANFILGFVLTFRWDKFNATLERDVMQLSTITDTQMANGVT